MARLLEKPPHSASIAVSVVLANNNDGPPHTRLSLGIVGVAVEVFSGEADFIHNPGRKLDISVVSSRCLYLLVEIVCRMPKTVDQVCPRIVGWISFQKPIPVR